MTVRQYEQTLSMNTHKVRQYEQTQSMNTHKVRRYDKRICLVDLDKNRSNYDQPYLVRYNRQLLNIILGQRSEMKPTPEKIQQLNLPKLIPTTNQKIKMNDLKVTQSKPNFYGVTVRSLHCIERSNFFSAELGQVESSTPLELKA